MKKVCKEVTGRQKLDLYIIEIKKSKGPNIEP